MARPEHLRGLLGSLGTPHLEADPGGPYVYRIPPDWVEGHAVMIAFGLAELAFAAAGASAPLGATEVMTRLSLPAEGLRLWVGEAAGRTVQLGVLVRHDGRVEIQGGERHDQVPAWIEFLTGQPAQRAAS